MFDLLGNGDNANMGNQHAGQINKNYENKKSFNIPQKGIDLLSGNHPPVQQSNNPFGSNPAQAPKKEVDPNFLNNDFDGEFGNNGGSGDFKWEGFGGGAEDWSKSKNNGQGGVGQFGKENSFGGATGGKGGSNFGAGGPGFGGMGSDGTVNTGIGGGSTNPFADDFKDNGGGNGGSGVNAFGNYGNKGVFQGFGSDGTGNPGVNPPNNNAFDQFQGAGSGSLIENKGKDGKSRFSYLFGGNKKKMDQMSSDEFDLQYRTYVNNQNEKGGCYDNTIVTDIKDHERIKYIEKKKGKYHVPFEGINLDEKVANIGSGIIRMAKKGEAILEAFERGVKKKILDTLNPRYVDEGALKETEDDMKASEMGTDISHINRGFGGEELEIGEFKFDEKFGGEYMKQKQQEEKMMANGMDGYYANGNQAYGSQFGQSNGDPFSNFGQTGNAGGQKSISNDGFLDFDSAFGDSSQSKNPFG